MGRCKGGRSGVSANIVLVTLDSLRADHCNATARGEDLAPTLRRMASQGVEYEYAVAPGPRTPSSMPAVFTGKHVPPVRAMPGDFWERRRSVIRQHMRRHRSLPEQLQDRGYHTIGVTVNPWTQNTGFDRGFDEFVHVNSGSLDEFGPRTFRIADVVLNDTALGDSISWFNKREWFIRWTDFYDAIITRLDEVTEPYLLWVFLLDTHQPYIVPPVDREESSILGMYYASFRELSTHGTVPSWVDTRLRRAYRDSIRSVDRFLDRLLRDTAADDPVVVVHSDHGEAFGEHDTYGHDQQLYEENIRVPLIIHNVPARPSVPDPVPLRRLPAIVDALVSPAEFDPTTYTTDYVIASIDDGRTDAVTTGDWKLIQGPSDNELYDLGRDPNERTDLTATHPRLAGYLQSLLRPHRSHRREQTRITGAATVTSQRQCTSQPMIQ